MRTLHSTATEVMDAISYAQVLPEVKDMISHMANQATDSLGLNVSAEEFEDSLYGMVNIWFRMMCDINDQTVAMAGLQAGIYDAYSTIYCNTIRSLDDGKHSDYEVTMARALTAKIYQAFLLFMPHVLHQLEWDAQASCYDEIHYINDLKEEESPSLNSDHDWDSDSFFDDEEDDYHEI